MSLDNYTAIFSAVISSAGLLLVVLQLRDTNRQRESESLVKIFDVNRQLLSLGFSYPQLFAILEDAKNADPVLERRYLQLWLNQLSLIHLYLKRSVFNKELQEFLEHEIADFMTLNNVRRYWQKNADAFPASFQNLVNGIIEKDGSLVATRHESGSQDLTGDLLKGGAGHPNEALSARSSQHVVLGRGGHVTLDEDIAVVGEDGGRTRATIAQLGKQSIFPDNFLDFHFSFVFRLIRLLKQNYSKCFNPEWGGAFV